MDGTRKLKLMLVEDDESDLEAYKDNIEMFGQENNLEFVLCVKEGLEEAREVLSSDFDAAIIDLRLKDDKNNNEPGGIELITTILNDFRIPTFVYTGTPAYVNLIERDNNSFFKKYVKAEVNISEILKEIKTIFDSGITKIIGGKGLIEEMLHKIMWEHIAEHLDLESLKPNSEEKLLRYIATHLQEYLDIGDSGISDKYVPAEVYIYPPIEDRISTGTILKEKEGGEVFIILTPACDFAQSKTERILLAAIEDISKNKICNQKLKMVKDQSALPEKREKAEETLKKIISNNFFYHYYFLPPTKELRGGIINFQKLKAIKLKDAEKKFDKIATITSSFKKDIVARFSFYYSRQGAPDLEREQLAEKLFSV